MPRSSLSRALLIGLALALLGAYVVRGSRKRPGLILPPLCIDNGGKAPCSRLGPDPHFKFTCPSGWSCPDLEHPHTWEPPKRYMDRQYPTEGTKETRI